MKLKILVGSGRKIGLLTGLVVYASSGIYSPEEEKILAMIFGESWDQYRKKVLLPWL
jgi:protein-S-isoprenylcysteine O-methyltransferase Ste14